MASPGDEQRKRSLHLKPEKFAKNGKQPTPQPAMRINSRNKFQFSLTFSKYLLKFSLKLSKVFKIFKIFKICSNFHKLFQNKVINLIYNTVYLNCSKFLQTLMKFRKFFKYCLNVFKNCFIFKQVSYFNNFLKHSYISYLFKMF